MSEQPQPQVQPGAADQPLFGIEKIYLKDMSLELPNAPQVFFEHDAPQIEVSMHNEAARMTQEGLYNVTLTVTVTAKLQDRTVFLCGSRSGRHFPDPQLAAGRSGSRPGHALPQYAAPVRPRSGRKRRAARRLPARYVAAHELRRDLSAAAAADAGGAVSRGECARVAASDSLMNAGLRRVLAAALFAAMLASGPTFALDFRAVSEPVAILYDGPSVKAKPVYIVNRGYPLEVLVTVEGWVKVRDANGTLAWVESKQLTDKRTVMVKVPSADRPPEAGRERTRELPGAAERRARSDRSERTMGLRPSSRCGHRLRQGAAGLGRVSGWRSPMFPSRNLPSFCRVPEGKSRTRLD